MSKKKPTDEKKTAPVGEAYICISPHDEPLAPGVFVKRLAGDEETFEKNPGPYWRPVKEIKKTEEVTEDATAD